MSLSFKNAESTKLCYNSSLSAKDRDNLRVSALPAADLRDGRPHPHLQTAPSLEGLPLPPPAEEGGGVSGDQSVSVISIGFKLSQ